MGLSDEEAAERGEGACEEQAIPLPPSPFRNQRNQTDKSLKYILYKLLNRESAGPPVACTWTHVGLGLRPGTPSLSVSVYYVFADASEVLHHFITSQFTPA